MGQILLRQCPPNKAIVLQNETCPYCGVELTEANSDNDHVIGRRFVPKGALNEEWNLILRACKTCNNNKSDLEDDISAIILQPDAWGQYARVDTLRDNEARRKARRSRSRRTGKKVEDSKERIDIDLPVVSGVTFSFSATSPPQLDNERAFTLCHYQIRAFFYWITYNGDSQRGGFWLGDFVPLLLAPRSDWGNSLHRAFMDAVRNWPVRILGATASGYFKISIRRHPSETCWSWAVEWNENTRVVGFFGERAIIDRLITSFPAIDRSIVRRGNQITRFREEARLSEEDDRLFC